MIFVRHRFLHVMVTVLLQHTRHRIILPNVKVVNLAAMMMVLLLHCRHTNNLPLGTHLVPSGSHNYKAK